LSFTQSSRISDRYRGGLDQKEETQVMLSLSMTVTAMPAFPRSGLSND
jgi:hypothetical protein